MDKTRDMNALKETRYMVKRARAVKMRNNLHTDAEDAILRSIENRITDLEIDELPLVDNLDAAKGIFFVASLTMVTIVAIVLIKIFG